MEDWLLYILVVLAFSSISWCAYFYAKDRGQFDARVLNVTLPRWAIGPVNILANWLVWPLFCALVFGAVVRRFLHVNTELCLLMMCGVFLGVLANTVNEATARFVA